MILLYHLYTQEREEEKGEIVVIIISQRNIVKWEERGESTFCFLKILIRIRSHLRNHDPI